MMLTSLCRPFDRSRVTAISPAVRPPSAPLSAAILIQRIGAVFSGLPDTRGKSNNQRYVMQDAALSAFSIFITQSPSFLDSQVRMQKQQGKNNAASLFGVHEIPSDNQIRNVLDPVPPETLFPLMATISDELYRDGYLDDFRSINGTMRHGASLIWATICIATSGIASGCLDNTPTSCLPARKIENENNNTLKTKGYHFEHNFGHGKQHLSNLFATMILLAFLVHTTLD